MYTDFNCNESNILEILFLWIVIKKQILSTITPRF